MTSSTWTSETALRLIGCGVDAERPERFEKLGAVRKPWRLVYSEREVAHAQGLADPAQGYCAAFCCKEAVVKALEESFPFPECEVFYREDETATIRLSDDLAARSGVRASEVRPPAPPRASW
ncbi:MAG: 4'-phosphopantetheinyl transferase superfamily protein [Deltaproteobacteria bacterium]|nr:4'-phosphopantetheinyl transferase superfamily protein [Deltaproteobacteria bacterium]